MDKLTQEIHQRLGKDVDLKKVITDCVSRFGAIDDADLLNMIDMYDEYGSFIKSKGHRIMLTNILKDIKMEIDNFMYNAKNEFDSVVSTGSIKAYELIKFRLTNEKAFDYNRNLLHIEKVRRECESYD